MNSDAGEDLENAEDSAQIISDQDQTLPEDADDHNMGAEGTDLQESDLDVAQQMERAARKQSHPSSDVGEQPDNNR
jgi:hypothetical protein